MNKLLHIKKLLKILYIVILKDVKVTSGVIVLALFILPSLGKAQSSNEGLVKPEAIQSGGLLLKSVRAGEFVEAPRIASDYHVTVSGPTARTVVTQRFQNPTSGYVEGVYVFPLPEGSAVDSLALVEGNRVLIGEIKSSQDARAIYEWAKSTGLGSSLLEQERPNIFTNAVANIGPYETVVVQIEYQEAIRQKDGVFSLRLPLVVAPRYVPATSPRDQEMINFNGQGYSVATPEKNTKQALDDARRISPPVINPALLAADNSTTITVELEPGFMLGEVKSLYHTVKMDEQKKTITLAQGAVPADKDFVLEWRAQGSSPQAGLFQETVQNKSYVLGYVVPPVVVTDYQAKPRETLFVLDDSGSMDGASFPQAQQSLIFALEHLKPADRFNIIRFDDTMSQFSPSPVMASSEYISKAKNYVQSLQASGGTDMVPPMREALKDNFTQDDNSLRQVIFITDGAISNEDELFATIAQGIGRTRLYMVGIGSAPNTYLMTRAAELGRGTFTFIGDTNDVQSKMQTLFAQLSNPVMTNLHADLIGNNGTISPQLLPDLYLGDPIMFMAQVENLNGYVKITGRLGDQPWQATLPIAQAAKGVGISKNWARRQIDDIEVQQIRRSLPQNEADDKILKLALDHHLVSRLTSLVAVDLAPKRPADQSLTRRDVPINLPAGWNFETVFGPRPGFYNDDSQFIREGYNGLIQLTKKNEAIEKGFQSIAQSGLLEPRGELEGLADSGQLARLTKARSDESAQAGSGIMMRISPSVSHAKEATVIGQSAFEAQPPHSPAELTPMGKSLHSPEAPSLEVQNSPRLQAQQAQVQTTAEAAELSIRMNFIKIIIFLALLAVMLFGCGFALGHYFNRKKSASS